MTLTRTRELLPEVIWRESSPSTNAELRELLAEQGPLPHGTLLATANQTAGRGRAGRDWVTPPGTAIAASMLIRDASGATVDRDGAAARRSARSDASPQRLGVGWLPLIAGSAITTALQPYFGDGMRVGTKWPNDVHVRDEEDAIAGRPGLKLCGILCELRQDGSVIVGTGINLLLPEDDLPTDRATSLLAAGADVGGARSLDDEDGRDLADRVLVSYAGEMLSLLERADTHPDAVRSRVLRHSLTIGTEVRVHLPGDEIIEGRARGLADDGSLIVDRPAGGQITVSAGDVEHLR